MKKFLLSFLCLFLLGSYAFSQQSQLTGACGVRDILIQNIRTGSDVPGDGKCDVLFDVSFTMDANSGNKTIYIATYIESTTATGNPNPYPDHFKCTAGGLGTEKKTPKTLDEVGDPLLLLVIDNESRTDPPQYLSTYTPEPNAYNNGQITTPTTPPTVETNADGSLRFTLKNVPITLPYDCGSATSVLITDVFATQAASANQAHCVNCGIRTGAGRVSFTGTVNCDIITGSFTNNTSSPLTVTYSYYVESTGDGVLSTSSDIKIFGPTTTSSIAGGATLSLSPVQIPAIYAGQDVYVLINVGGTERAQLVPAAACSPLPAKLKSFNARRANGQSVALNWTTSTESDNKGFYVQRKTNGAWENLSFVESKAQSGNSVSDLYYTYNDANSNKGVSQYRLQQVDLNGKTSMSEIRSVRGEEMSGRALVYPNPSNEGGVNLVFDNARGERDVWVSDMSGRVLKQWRSVTDNSMRISGLQPGTYTLRVINKQDGSQQYEKLVINR